MRRPSGDYDISSECIFFEVLQAILQFSLGFFLKWQIIKISCHIYDLSFDGINWYSELNIIIYRENTVRFQFFSELFLRIKSQFTDGVPFLQKFDHSFKKKVFFKKKFNHFSNIFLKYDSNNLKNLPFFFVKLPTFTIYEKVSQKNNNNRDQFLQLIRKIFWFLKNLRKTFCKMTISFLKNEDIYDGGSKY